MAKTLKYILQDISTNEYLTETGWSSNMDDAKHYIQSDVDALPIGKYLVIWVWVVS